MSLDEFLNTVAQFSRQGDDEKLSFLFRVYDSNNDGIIDLDELKEILKACSAENGLELNDEQIEDLTSGLFEDAVNSSHQGISLEDLRQEFKKHDGLLENLTLPMVKWLMPAKTRDEKCFKKKLVDKVPYFFAFSYVEKNLPFVSFLIAILIINIALFIDAALDHVESSSIRKPFYLLARASGRTLLFNSILVLVLVLRYTNTVLRDFGFASILPLDTHIYFHKVVGRLIFYQSIVHTMMHLICCYVSVKEDPVKFLQINFGSEWTDQGYNVPKGCKIISINSSSSEFCKEDVFDDNDAIANLTHCQYCQDDQMKYSYWDWMMTTKPGVFGLSGGVGNPSGLGLMLIMMVMTVYSLSFVRRSGNFQVFYFSHLLYWCYYPIIILHAPNFWKYFIFFGAIFLAEKFFRTMSFIMGRGQTVIDEAVSLQSKVTYLKIRKLPKFNHSPGDWCFIKVIISVS